MAHQHSKGRYHPSRISGMQKQMRAREVNALNKKKKKDELDKLELGKPNWSSKKNGHNT